MKVNIDFQSCVLSSFSCSMISFACVEPDIACRVNQLNVEQDFQIPMFVKKPKEEAREQFSAFRPFYVMGCNWTRQLGLHRGQLKNQREVGTIIICHVAV